MPGHQGGPPGCADVPLSVALQQRRGQLKAFQEEEFEQPPMLNLTSILRDAEQSLDLSQVQFYNDDAVDKLDLLSKDDVSR